MDNFNDPIIQQLAKAYIQLSELYHGNVSDCMNQCKEVHPHLSTEQCKEQYCQDSMTTQGSVNEGHKHEELVKLSNEELNDLVDEYTKKVAETEGEEKEHHEKELADIKDILASRKDDKEEVKEEAEDHLGAAHSALEDAGKHYNSFDRGYDSAAVPHMKRAKEALAKARAAGHDTKEADARYKDIHDRIDAPHRKELEQVKEGLIKDTLQRIKNRLMSGDSKFETNKELKDRKKEEAMIDAEEAKTNAKNKNPHRDVPREGLPDWMQRRMDKWNTEEDAKPIKEVYRLTPGRAKVLDKADADAGDALHASVGSTDPKVKERAHTELGKSLRAEILRQMTKPEGKRSGAWAGTTDPELKNHLNWARKPKSQLGESAKEIVQNINEMMKTIKGKKNGKSK